jgi:hypothetical protein
MSLLNHSVQFYNDDIFLTQSVARFITEGLQGNETVIVVATAQHREALQQVLTPEQMTHEKRRVFSATSISTSWRRRVSRAASS